MALFGLKKDKKEVKKPAKKKAETASSAPTVPAFEKAKAEKIVVLRPHITEKATTMAEARVYTFEVAMDANKIEIKKAIKKLYNVSPVAVRIVRSTPRREMQFRTRRMAMRPGSKKAYVTLKEGEQISFV